MRHFFSPCPRGLEALLAEELAACGASDIQPTAGGCAFDGAKIALQPIVDVAHLVHGPIACEGNSWDNRHSASSGPKTYRLGFTTDINELDVIHGAEKRLFKAIREVIERQDPAAVFVYQTCVTGMIGDDIELMADFNQGLDMAEALSRCPAIDDLGLAGGGRQHERAALPVGEGHSIVSKNPVRCRHALHPLAAARRRIGVAGENAGPGRRVGPVLRPAENAA